MEIGLAMFPTDRAIQPAELAQAAEAAGFESLWFPEHSHIPTSRVTPWGGRQGAPPLPEMYWRTHDQLIALTAAAAATTTIKVATGISLVAQRDPLWLAKQTASLDMISGGRFIFGVGYGWNKEEMAHHGVRYTERRAILREKMLAIKAVWTQDEAEFHGEHVDFSPSWSWPKPVQRPHPPIIMGGSAGPRTFADIAEFCDGWMPIASRSDIVVKASALRRAAEDAGREPTSLSLGVFFAKPDPETLDAYVEAGVSRVVFGVPPEGPEVVLPQIESLAPFVERYRS